MGDVSTQAETQVRRLWRNRKPLVVREWEDYFCNPCAAAKGKAAGRREAFREAPVALRKYLKHEPDCAKINYHTPDNTPCDCGLTAAIRALATDETNRGYAATDRRTDP